MRKNNFLKIISFLFLGILIFTSPSLSQSGNQSDITGPNPLEINPTGNQSDITGPNPLEIKPSSSEIKLNIELEIEQQQNPQSSGETQTKPEKISTNGGQKENNQTTPIIKVDRVSYNTLLQQSNIFQAVQLQEEFQAVQFQDYLGINLYGKNPSAKEISWKLWELEQKTETRSALVYVSLAEKEILIYGILPFNPLLPNSNFSFAAKTSGISRQNILETIKKYQEEISDEFQVNSQKYLPHAQQLYDWIIAPIDAQLQANNINTIVFTMDLGLRSLPIAALHDGKSFLIEKYAVALIPSFGLTDTSYVDIRNSSILAMGASRFQDNIPLPAVPTELNLAIANPRQGKTFLNEKFTTNNFIDQNLQENFAIIHLGTHAEFKQGDRNSSYIQFFNQKLNMTQLVKITDELGWSFANISPELLVLSACQTALGDKEAELGFAGLAVAAGVKSALASLWNVSDLGTLGLMGQFYQNLSLIPLKVEVLRQAQLAMLQGKVRVNNGTIILADGSKIKLPPEIPQGSLTFSHPYYWAAFTLVGNWN